ncbi:MAG: hypothetical protein ACK5MA_01885, partial [Parachlamydiaceae bacterium]
TSDAGKSYQYDYFEDDKNNTANRFYLAFNFGAEYRFQNNFFIDTRYQAGITDLNVPPTELSKTLMNFFQLGIGYRFYPKKKD